MDEYPVKVGSMLFTLVDPHRGHERAYNRWYERDHFYGGCMVGPWLFAGRRWVATRALKNLRYPDASKLAVPVDAGSYLATYWVHADHHADHFAWAGQQVVELYSSGRGFAERTHAHTVLYLEPWATYRDSDPVPLELALDHGFAGLVVVALDRTESTSEEELQSFLRDEALPALHKDSPVAIAASWKPVPMAGGSSSGAPMDLGTPSGGEERTLQMFFCDEEPAGMWARVQAYTTAVEASGKAEVVFAGPFIPTVVGTDTYVDELW